MSTAERIWSPLQEAIFSHVSNPAGGNLVVSALAGTGKSTTIEEAVLRIEPQASVLVVAFNKSIAEAMKQRLDDPGITVCTLHSFGMRILREAGCRIDVDGRQAGSLLQRSLGPGSRKEKAYILKLLGLAKGSLAEGRELGALADSFELFAPKGPMRPKQLLEITASLLKQQAQPRRSKIDFDDMIWLPEVWGLASPQFDYVVVDELQDLNAAQLELCMNAVKTGGRFIGVGDSNQCHPGYTMVRTPTGNVRIDSLKVGDRVVGWDRHSQKLLANRTIQAVAARPYWGPILRVTTNEAHTVDATPNHEFVARWVDRKSEQCVTYLMWRKGLGFRVGWCQLFNANGTFHLGHRARIEKADKVWILKVHTSRTEASTYESIVAADYGLPTSTFEPVNGAQHITRIEIDKIFSALSDLNDCRGLDCLAMHGRLFEHQLYPHHEREGRAAGRRTLFRVHAVNLEPGLMAVPSSEQTLGWTTVSKVARLPYCGSGVVYSLKVSHSETYVADNVVVHNCIYQFRGADSQSMRKAQERTQAQLLPLSITYRCSQAVVREANRFVPELQAAPGAQEGVVRIADESELFECAEPGDFVLSRLNAPLVKLAYKWLRAGVACEIKGRNIGADLISFIEGLKARTCDELKALVGRWLEGQKADSEKTQRALASADDRAECVLALASECSTVAEITERIEEMFADSAGGDSSSLITLSSTHKAKGLEAERVWLLANTYRPQEGGEEINLFYVAQTRAKRELIYVGDPGFDKVAAE